MPNNNDLDIDGLVPERRNFSALAMELRLSCTNTSIYIFIKSDDFLATVYDVVAHLIPGHMS